MVVWEGALGEEGLLGQLDHEPVGASRRGEVAHEIGHEADVAGLLGGDVEADRGAGAEGGVDVPERRHRLVEHHARDVVDHPEFDREPDEIARGLDEAGLVAPAQQHFEPHRAVRVDVDLGLVGAQEPPVPDGEAQPLLRLHAAVGRHPHRVVEERDVALAVGLDAVHGDVGVAPERLVVAPVGREQADADRGRGEDLVAIDEERLLEAGEQGLHLPHDVAPPLHQEQELVAADAAQDHALLQGAREAVGDLDQDLVAHGMPVIVVDVLEAVEIDEGEREGLVAPAHQLGHRGLQVAAVRQVGEFVVIGAAEELGLGLALAREVDRGGQPVGRAADRDIGADVGGRR